MNKPSTTTSATNNNHTMSSHQQQQTDATRDRVTALLRQEDLFYRCSDAYYCCNGLAVVQECAGIVTDSTVGDVEMNDTTSKNNIIKVTSLSSISDVRDIQDATNPAPSCAGEQQQHLEHIFWRQQMFDWSNTVVDSFGMDREAVAVSFNLLDRYLACECAKEGCPEITRDDYQLYSMVCLYIAVKIWETYPRKLSVQVLVDMSKNFYSKQVIETTERDILEALNWHLHPSTAISFARLLQELLPAAATAALSSSSSFHMQATAHTITELAVSDPFFVAFPNSCVGLAALLHAARLEGLSEAVLHKFMAETRDLVDTESSDFRAVYLHLEKLYCH